MAALTSIEVEAADGHYQADILRLPFSIHPDSPRIGANTKPIVLDSKDDDLKGILRIFDLNVIVREAEEPYPDLGRRRKKRRFDPSAVIEGALNLAGAITYIYGGTLDTYVQNNPFLITNLLK